MKKEIAKKWVKALRSGKYKQGKRALKVETKKGVQQHCCLGVLCELYQQDREKKQALPLTTRDMPLAESNATGHISSSVKKIFAFGRDEYTTVVPPSVQRWAGLMDPAGEFRECRSSLLPKRSGSMSVCDSLAELNDAGASFKRIADIIENSVEQL